MVFSYSLCFGMIYEKKNGFSGEHKSSCDAVLETDRSQMASFL